MKKRSAPDGQLALFGEPSAARASEARPRRPGKELGQIPDADPRLIEVGRHVPKNVFMGASSWTFSGWKDFVYRRTYPSQQAFMKHALEEYARHPLLTTVGIDRSYYGPIPAHELAVYANQVPQGYRMTMKVWEELTTLIFSEHPRSGARANQTNPLFLDVATFAEHVALPVEEAFRPHLASYVIEVPPTSRAPDNTFFETRLERFLAETSMWGPFSVELRDSRLLTRRYVEILRQHGASHCFNFWSRMPSIVKQRGLIRELGGPDSGVLGPVVVARLMLPPGRQYSAQKEAFAPFDRIVVPQPKMRDEVLELADACVRAALPLYIIVNNKAEGSAPLTIEALAELFREREQASPPNEDKTP